MWLEKQNWGNSPLCLVDYTSEQRLEQTGPSVGTSCLLALAGGRRAQCQSLAYHDWESPLLSYPKGQGSGGRGRRAGARQQWAKICYKAVTVWDREAWLWNEQGRGRCCWDWWVIWRRMLLYLSSAAWHVVWGRMAGWGPPLHALGSDTAPRETCVSQQGPGEMVEYARLNQCTNMEHSDNE